MPAVMTWHACIGAPGLLDMRLLDGEIKPAAAIAGAVGKAGDEQFIAHTLSTVSPRRDALRSVS